MCWRSRTPGTTGGHFRRWLHIDDEATGQSNTQLHLMSGEFFCGTDLLRRHPSERRQEEDEAMEGLKTLQPDTSPPAFEVQGGQKNPTRPSSSGKLLQLTPLWEHVVKNQLIPPEVDKGLLFAELTARLGDLEWEVRGHALRVLMDLIPVMELSELDRYMMPVLLRELTCNLGHSAPSVRKGALDTLGVYLRHSADPETVLRNIVVEGLEKQTAKGNIAMGVILSIPSLVNPLLTPTNGIVLISQTGLIHLVSALSKKLVQDTYQEQSVKTLVRIREMVGEARFDRFLEGFHPQCKKDFDILCQVYDVGMHLGDSGIDLQAPPSGEDSLLRGAAPDGWSSGHGYWSDGSAAASSSTVSPEDALFRDQNQNLIFLGDKSSSSENMADSSPSPKDDDTSDMGPMSEVSHVTRTDTDDYEPNNAYGEGEMLKNDRRNYRGTRSEEAAGIQRMIADRNYGGEEEKLEVEIEERAVSLVENKEAEGGAVTVMEGDALDEEVLNFSRVILETEIKFDEDSAIMMTILEEGNGSPRGTVSLDETCSVDRSRAVEYAEKGRGSGADGEGNRVYNNDFVMKILADDEDYNDDDDVATPDEPIRRTPRRVRFGGEMVLMCTPDSEQQDGDSNPLQDKEDPTVGRADIADTAEGSGEDSFVCREENSLRGSSRRDSISFATDADPPVESRREPIVYTGQDTLDDARQDVLKDSRRDFIPSTRQDTIFEIKQDSLDGTGRCSAQDPLESSLRHSVQVGVPHGSTGDGTQTAIVQKCLEDTGRDCTEAEGQEQDSLGNCGRVSVQEGRRDLLEDRGQDAREDTRQRTVEGSKQSCVQDATEVQIEETMEILTEAVAGDVEHTDEEASTVLQSHIPLPVAPARNKPKDHKRRGTLYQKRQKTRGSETSTDTQQGSSDQAEDTQAKQDSGQDSKSRAVEGAEGKDDVAGQEYSDENWKQLGIVTESVLEDLHDQVRNPQHDSNYFILIIFKYSLSFTYIYRENVFHS